MRCWKLIFSKLDINRGQDTTIYFWLNDNNHGVMPEFQGGDELYPDAIYAMGLCKFQVTDYKGVIAEWEKAKSAGYKGCSTKLAEGYLKSGNQYKDDKKFPAAVSCIDKALENSPDDLNVLFSKKFIFIPKILHIV